MDEEKALHEWGLRVCPLRGKQCLCKGCAWWLEKEQTCAIKKISQNKE
ncbi:MAG: hypothetical protein JW946_02545 [Candidatus Omnitrophica bacterium]|nr:hypothetical protein [Candidatus Omnitrophota bacterium]